MEPVFTPALQLGDTGWRHSELSIFAGQDARLTASALTTLKSWLALASSEASDMIITPSSVLKEQVKTAIRLPSRCKMADGKTLCKESISSHQQRHKGFN